MTAETSAKPLKGNSMSSEQRLRNTGCSSGQKSKRKSTSLPPETVEYLKNWMMSPEHIAHPYPTEQEKAQIMKETGIELKQLTNWFVNNRKRYWKPRVEARLQEQAKAHGNTPHASSTPLTSTTKATPVPVSPARRRSLVHVVSSANVASLAGDRPEGIVSPIAGSRPISEISSVSSDADSLGMPLDQEDEMSAGQTTDEPVVCKEHVGVHILTPRSGKPTLDDVVVGSVVSGKDEVLRSYDDCEMIYFVSSKKDETERNTEVDRLKKHCLGLFLADWKKEAAKRKAQEEEVEDIAPRPKYRRMSVETWKKACEDADHGYCRTLPTLEEAARLFGFAV